jgi:hypothetical protein
MAVYLRSATMAVMTPVVLSACAAPVVAPTATPTSAPTSIAALASATAAPVASPTVIVTTTAVATSNAASYRDATYEVDGKRVTLTNGLSEVEAAPGSASKVVTRIFGSDASGDLNGDGKADIGFLLTQSSGGSGTLFYAVVALRTSNGWTGTNAVLLGDRVAPQPSQVRDGVLIVNYAERKPGEPMTERPSVGVSTYLRVVNGTLVE